jgi:hypothetical protein
MRPFFGRTFPSVVPEYWYDLLPLSLMPSFKPVVAIFAPADPPCGQRVFPF